MTAIKLTLSTADHDATMFIPATDDQGTPLAEDLVLDLLRAAATDAFYVALGYPARDVLLAGDPWHSHNGDGVEADWRICDCGHARFQHDYPAGGHGCRYCGCPEFHRSPAAAPARADPFEEPGTAAELTHVVPDDGLPF
jgi:hypothetical protein